MTSLSRIFVPATFASIEKTVDVVGSAREASSRRFNLGNGSDRAYRNGGSVSAFLQISNFTELLSGQA
jgi:hypothetical protein